MAVKTMPEIKSLTRKKKETEIIHKRQLFIFNGACSAGMTDNAPYN